MAKKQKAPGAAKASTDVLSGTLEEYFASHRGSGEVSSHLLIGTPSHDAMASEPIDSLGSTQHTELVTTEAVEEDAPSHGAVQGDESFGKEEPLSKPKAEDTSVAGLTLGDYMDVADDKEDGYGVKKKAIAQIQGKPKTKGKASGAVVVVPGMSLDSYLGVAADGNEEITDDDSHEDNEASIARKKKAKKTLSPSKEVGKKPAKSKLAVPPPPVASEECVTPFQRHQKKKQRAKNKLEQFQQPQGTVLSGSGGAGPVSRSILMTDSLLSPSVHETLKTNRKKAKSSTQPQHQLSPSQSPLPKLMDQHSGPPTSIASGHHGNDSVSSADKLPPL